MKALLCSAVALATGFSVASTNAQTMLDLKGTWKGTGEAIVEGAASHHPPTAESKPAANFRLRKQEFTYKIDGQDAKRFWGTFNSEHFSNTFVGSISLDGKWIYVASRDGLGDGAVIDNDTIQMCWRQTTPSAVLVGCNEMKRQK